MAVARLFVPPLRDETEGFGFVEDFGCVDGELLSIRAVLVS